MSRFQVPSYNLSFAECQSVRQSLETIAKENLIVLESDAHFNRDLEYLTNPQPVSEINKLENILDDYGDLPELPYCNTSVNTDLHSTASYAVTHPSRVRRLRSSTILSQSPSVNSLNNEIDPFSLPILTRKTSSSDPLPNYHSKKILDERNDNSSLLNKPRVR